VSTKKKTIPPNGGIYGIIANMFTREKIIQVSFLLLAVIGLVNSLIIYQKILGNIFVPCLIGQGCDNVLYSIYSKFMGVPLSLWGIVFYGVYFICAAFFLIKPNKISLNILTSIVLLGFGFSIRLFYLQVFIIKSLCSYCLVSLFVICASLFLVILMKRRSILFS